MFRDEKIVVGLWDVGITQISTFQLDLIKIINDAQNVLAKSSPGTGKTIVFAIAILRHVDVRKRYPHVLVICSTHESAFEMCKILTRIGTYTDIKVGSALQDANGNILKSG